MEPDFGPCRTLFLYNNCIRLLPEIRPFNFVILHILLRDIEKWRKNICL
jgi:hypothetical protein